MRPLRALAIYIAVVFLGGALLAPWLYWLAQHCADSFPKLAHSPFHRYVNRSMYALALIGLWPLLKNLGATSPRDAGLTNPAGHGKKIGAGFLLGFASLAFVAGPALLAGARQFSEHLSAGRIGNRMLTAALTAVVVSVLEEILFRGGIFGGLRRVFDWRLSLLVSSMIYAIVHFLAPTKDPAAVDWTSGLQQLGLMLGGFTDWQKVIPGFFNLTLVGVQLAFAYQRTGNLYFSMGLHAGWIFWLKSYATITAGVPGANTWLFGTEKMIDGWIALPVLAAALWAFRRCCAGSTAPPPTGKPESPS